jgi:hypothetical protein
MERRGAQPAGSLKDASLVILVLGDATAGHSAGPARSPRRHRRSLSVLIEPR